VIKTSINQVSTMTVHNYTIINGVTLTVAQTATIFDACCTLYDGQCAKLRCKLGAKPSSFLVFASGKPCVEQALDYKQSLEDDVQYEDHQCEFDGAMEADLKEYYGLSFDLVLHDAPDYDTNYAVLGYHSGRVAPRCTSSGSLDDAACSFYKMPNKDQRSELTLPLSHMMEDDQVQAILNNYGIYLVADDCHCCS